MNSNAKILALATAATATLGAIAVCYKKYCNANREKSLPAYPDTTGTGDVDDIGPGEIDPYVDTPTDPKNQN